jgi:hypothetical protein
MMSPKLKMEASWKQNQDKKNWRNSASSGRPTWINGKNPDCPRKNIAGSTILFIIASGIGKPGLNPEIYRSSLSRWHHNPSTPAHMF